jgi:hypothetical protein
VFGIVLGWVQSGKRKWQLSVPISVMVSMGLVRAFSESTDKIAEVYVYIGFSMAIIVACLIVRRSENLKTHI